MSDPTAWLGIDVGTQSARAVALSESGEILAAGSEPLSGRREGERHEQDPAVWWEAVAAACRAAATDLAPESIGGVAACGTSGTVLLVDAAGAPLTPGLMYDDSRAAQDAERANEVGAAVWESLGYRIQSAWGLPKLLWLLREHGDAAAGARLAHQVDVVTRRLVGAEVPSDSSHALKSGYDLLGERWPHEVMSELGVPDGLLPEVVRAGTRLGTVGRAGSEATGLPEGVPVIAGMTDGCAAQLAAGALGLGDWNSVLGTTLVLKGVSAEPVRDPLGVVYSHRAPDGMSRRGMSRRGRWLPGGASSAGAGVLSARFPDRDLSELDRRAARHEPAGVLAYPLASRGERFPFAAPEAEGFLVGTPADEADHHAALLQSVAYVERLCFDHLDRLGVPVDGELSLTGGATRSRYWCQLRADVLGRPVRLPAHAEPAVGMALLAASEGRSPAELARELVGVREVIEPRADRAGRWREPYGRWLDELERRGWLDGALAAHARARAAG